MVKALHYRRLTGLNQRNKSFISQQATKLSLKKLAKCVLIFSALSASHVLRRDVLSVPSQAATQAAKYASLVTFTRTSNGVDGAPRIVSHPLCEDIRTVDAIRGLATFVHGIYGTG
ncbi:hypothetical protein HD554DRAFT_2178174 [Boletus coccyginus]|nr:hypothetical protein HD554DRAFT_2178174 [Boletus coccyginus]